MFVAEILNTHKYQFDIIAPLRLLLGPAVPVALSIVLWNGLYGARVLCRCLCVHMQCEWYALVARRRTRARGFALWKCEYNI